MGDPTNPKKILVNEIFGPTMQGEGPSLGIPCAFLRVAACNLRCTWCDTYYTWDWHRVNKEDEVHPMEVDEVYRRLGAVAPAKGNLLVVSGGEPMLQQARLAPLLKMIRETGLYHRIEIETAGTIQPTGEFLPLIDQFNVSPKLEHSGNEKRLRYRPEALDALMGTGKAVWQFVAQRPEDFPEMDELIRAHSLSPVFIMPEGTDAETISAHAHAILPAVVERGWRMTPRLHIELWGTQRGH